MSYTLAHMLESVLLALVRITSLSLFNSIEKDV